MGGNTDPGIVAVHSYNKNVPKKPQNVEHPFWGRQLEKVTVFDKSERWEGKYVQRGWEMQSKVTVELPTDRPVLGQSVDRLPVDDWQQGRQVGTEGRQSQAPANHPRADQLLLAHIDTLFQEID